MDLRFAGRILPLLVLATAGGVTYGLTENDSNVIKIQKDQSWSANDRFYNLASQNVVPLGSSLTASWVSFAVQIPAAGGALKIGHLVTNAGQVKPTTDMKAAANSSGTPQLGWLTAPASFLSDGPTEPTTWSFYCAPFQSPDHIDYSASAPDSNWTVLINVDTTESAALAGLPAHGSTGTSNPSGEYFGTTSAWCAFRYVNTTTGREHTITYYPTQP